MVFQPRKVERSGLAEAVSGRVLIYVHKAEMLEDVAARFPAGHYVMIDDKLRLLTAMKAIRGPRLTTVFVQQGHYAHCCFLAIVLGGFHLPIDDNHEVLLRNGVGDADDFKSELVEMAFQGSCQSLGIVVGCGPHFEHRRIVRDFARRQLSLLPSKASASEGLVAPRYDRIAPPRGL